MNSFILLAVQVGFGVTGTAQELVDDNFVLVTDAKSGIYQLDLVGETVERIPVEVSNVRAVTYSKQLGRMYWADWTAGVIKSARLNGSEEITLVEGYQANELAIDHVNGRLFFTDNARSAIYKVSVDGGSTIEVAKAGNVPHKEFGYGIVVDYRSNGIIWVQRSPQPAKIMRSDFDGNDRQMLVTGDMILPVGVAVDEKEICWCDYGNGKVQCVDRDGTNRRILYSANLYFFDLDMNEKYIYLSALNGNLGLFRLDRNTLEFKEMEFGKFDRMYGIDLQDSGPCGRANAGCDHVCNNTAGGYVCSCGEGFELDEDEHNCTDINECDRDNGGCENLCENLVGGYKCSCDDGFELDKDNHTCNDINECERNNGCGEHLCENLVGGYKCSCYKGFKLGDDQHSCKDINECDTNNGGCERFCENLLGSYECSCESGYELRYDERTCKAVSCPTGKDRVMCAFTEKQCKRAGCCWDPNEAVKCAHENNKCDNEYACVEGATCTDLGYGQFTCDCPPGYPAGVSCHTRRLLGSCAVKPEHRIPCGRVIKRKIKNSRQACESRGCCYNNKKKKARWCFHPILPGCLKINVWG